MADDTRSIDRRTLLKQTGVLAAAGVGSTGLASAAGKGERGEGISGSGSGGMTLTADNAMSRGEFDDFKRRMAKKYGADMAASIDPADAAGGGFSTEQASVDTQNLTWEASWNDDFDVSADVGKLATTDHALTLYKGETTDDNGRDLYFFWQWSQSDAVTSWYTAKTDFMRNHVDVTDYTHKLTDFDPAGPIDVNGQWVNVGLSVGYNGITMGLNGEMYVKDGTVKPETGKVDTGSAGQYAVAFEGCKKDTTGLNGAVETRSTDYIYKGDVDWNVYVHCTTHKGCW